MDWFKIGKGECEGYLLSLGLFNFLKNIQNTRVDDSQAEIKIAGRNINNLRYAYHSNGRK